MSGLRKAGRLNEAREAAAALLARYPDDPYARRAVAWVYLDCIKKDSLTLEEALPWAEQLLGLQPDASEVLLWEQLYWQMARLLFRLGEVPGASVTERLRAIWSCWPRLACQGYSTLLKALLKQAAQWPDLPAWVEAWGWEHLRSEDFLPETLPSGMNLPALAERAGIAVAKVYLSQPGTEDALRTFLDRLDTLSEANPSLLYLVYYRALLWQKTGNRDQALEIFLPFARRRKRDFWVWDLLGQLHSADPALRGACLAKALQCPTKPEFLVKIRQQMADLLIAQGRWNEARAELEALCATRQQNGWKIPAAVAAWQRSPDYAQAMAVPTDSIYTSWIPLAEKLLRVARPETLALVWSINPQKQTVQFVADEQTHGGFSYARLGVAAGLGDLLWLQLERAHSPEGTTYWKVLEARPATEPAPPHLVRTLTGPVRKAGAVGFVDDVLIEPALMASLTGIGLCRVMAVRAYNPKKNCWGWKALNVEEGACN